MHHRGNTGAGGEERRRRYFFPKIKGSLVPVVCNIVEVEFDRGPEGSSDERGVTVLDEPVSISNHSGGTQRRSI